MSCDPEKRSVLLPTAVQRIDLVVQIADAHLHKVMGDQPMDLQLSGFAPEQFVMVQTASPPGEGVWKAQAPFLTDNYGCVALRSLAMILTWMLWATSGAHSRTGVISTIEKHSSLPLDWNGLHVPRASSPKLLLARIAPSMTSYRTSAILVL